MDSLFLIFITASSSDCQNLSKIMGRLSVGRTDSFFYDKRSLYSTKRGLRLFL